MSERDLNRRARRTRGTQFYDLREDSASGQGLDLITDNFSGRRRSSGVESARKTRGTSASTVSRERREATVDLPASRRPARNTRREEVSVDLPAARRPARNARREEVSVDLPAARRPARNTRREEVSVDLPAARRPARTARREEVSVDLPAARKPARAVRREEVSVDLPAARRPERNARREEVSVDLPAARRPARNARREEVSVDLPAARKPARAVRREEVSVDLPAARKPARNARREEVSIDLPAAREDRKSAATAAAPAEAIARRKRAWKDEAPTEDPLTSEVSPETEEAEDMTMAGPAPKKQSKKKPIRREESERVKTESDKTGRIEERVKEPAEIAAQSAEPRDSEKAAWKTQRRNSARKKGSVFGVLLGLFLMVSVVFAGAYVYTQGKLDLIQRLPWNKENLANNSLGAGTRELMKGYWTVAVFGVDSRDSNLGKGTNADVNMLVSINHDTGDIKLVSVFRDTYMKVDEKSYNKLNAAYRSGGPESAVWALNRNLDVEIDDYATFNWKAVAQAINIIGGIDVEINKDEFYYINAFITETVEATGIGSNHLKQAGMNHLDGVQAVAYGRLRLMDSDFRRTERQRKVIGLALEKMKKADLATLDRLVETVFPEVATSADMSDMIRMASNVGHYHISGTYGFPENNKLSRVKGRGSVVAPATLASNVTLLHKFLFNVDNYQPSEALQEISKHVSDVTNVGEMKGAAKSDASDSEDTSDESGAANAVTAAETTQAAKATTAAAQTAKKQENASAAKQTASQQTKKTSAAQSTKKTTNTQSTKKASNTQSTKKSSSTQTKKTTAKKTSASKTTQTSKAKTAKKSN